MTSDIITAINTCGPDKIAEIEAALEARKAAQKALLIAQCEALGIHCEDTNGKKRKRRTKANDEDKE